MEYNISDLWFSFMREFITISSFWLLYATCNTKLIGSPDPDGWDKNSPFCEAFSNMCVENMLISSTGHIIYLLLLAVMGCFGGYIVFPSIGIMGVVTFLRLSRYS